MKGRLEVNLKYKKSCEKALSENCPNILDDYFWYLSNHLEYSSVDAYIRILKSFATWLNPSDPSGADLINVTSNKINKYMESEAKYNNRVKERTGELKLNSYATRKRYFAALYGFYDYLVEEGIINRNPVSKRLRVRNSDETKKTFVDKDGLKAILNAIKSDKDKKNFKRNYLIFLLFITTGIRKSALISINRNDLNDDGILTVEDKRSKVQKCVLPQVVIDAWYEYDEERTKMLDGDPDKTDAFILSNRGTRISPRGLDKVITTYSKKGLGYEISPHKLRASFGTITYLATNDIILTMKAMGHSSVNTTKIYMVGNDNAKEKAAEIIVGSVLQ